jgi:hypothetical protein
VSLSAAEPCPERAEAEAGKKLGGWKATMREEERVRGKDKRAVPWQVSGR